MKKLLLGTTALVAAAGFSGIASAQQVTTKATSLAISGDVEFEGAYSDNDSTNRKVDFLSDGDFTFSPKYVADNGLTTTGRIDFQWNPSSSSHNGGDLATDELSVTFQSASFGSVTLGDDDGAADNFYQFGPVTGDGAWDGSAPRFAGFADGNGGGDGIQWAGDNIEPNLSGDATKIYYSTSGLDLAGFTFGASYAPSADDTFDSGNGLVKAVGNTHDVWDVGGTWEGQFSGVNLTVGGVYTVGKRDFSGDNPSGYNVGGTVGFGALKVGGGYTGYSDYYAAGADADVWAAGATYDIGAFTVGASYTKSDYDVGSNFDDSSAYGAAVSYAVAPGVTAKGEVNQFKNDDTGNDATVVMLGTQVDF